LLLIGTARHSRGILLTLGQRARGALSSGQLTLIVRASCWTRSWWTACPTHLDFAPPWSAC
jgi:hypothetical protein